jgi:hypothetical protein
MAFLHESAAPSDDIFEYQLEPYHSPVATMPWLDAVFDWHHSRDTNQHGCIITAARHYEHGWLVKIQYNDGIFLRSTVIYPIARLRKFELENATGPEDEYAYLERVAQQCSSALVKLRQPRGPAIRYTDEQIAKWVKEANDRVRKANEVRNGHKNE